MPRERLRRRVLMQRREAVTSATLWQWGGERAKLGLCVRRRADGRWLMMMVAVVGMILIGGRC